MNLIPDILILLVSVFALWGGAVWVVESATRIAKKLGISELVVGLTVVALGTSAPEFAVTITAAVKEQANISVGNVVGSNIFNLGFILGGIAIMHIVATTRKLIYRDGVILILSSLLLLFFLRDHVISRGEGIFLMLSLVAYILLLFLKKELLEEELPEGDFHWYEILRLIGGLSLIVAGGHYLVESSTNIARFFGLSEWVIGVTIVAAGTSAPEFATSLVAVVKGRHGISAGNLIGSNLFNLLGVLGLASTIKPMQIDSSAYSDIVWLTVVTVIAIVLLRSRWRLSRVEGILLFSINLVLWISIFMK